VAPMLHARGENFDERNPLAHLVLGLLSLGSRLDGLLAAHPGAPDDAPSPSDGHPWDDAVLGMIALRERLLGHLEAGCPAVDAGSVVDAGSGVDDAPVVARGRPREVLR
jgi:hypothetical protein